MTSLLVTLFFFYKRRAGREYRGKCEEQTAESGSEFFRNHAGGRGDQSAKEKPDRVVAPSDLSDGRDINFYFQFYLSQIAQEASAMPSQSVSIAPVTA